MTTEDSVHPRLLDLPNEIISSIFHCLQTPSPFLEANIQQPSPPTLGDGLNALKQASLLSRRLRKLALPYLFKHVLVNPSHLKRIFLFLASNNLDAHVSSVVAYLPTPCSHYHPPWWFQILSQLPKLSTLSVIAPPHIFSEITETNTRSRDIWAFNMPYHILQLHCDVSKLEVTSGWLEEARSSGDHLLLARPWTSVLINEGSSLKAYTTWEYWLRSTPSPVYALNDPHRLKSFISNLRSFSLVSIFPIFGHVGKALDLVKQMHHLRVLFIKLIPEPDSTVLNDEIEEALGHLDVNDPWNEFDTSLTLTSAACLYLSKCAEEENNDWGLPRLGKLQELRIDDVKMAGVRDNIEEIVCRGLIPLDRDESPDFGWAYTGNGVWKRNVEVGSEAV